MRERVRDWIGGLDMVSRDEFEAVKAIAVAAREESQALRARIEALEAGQAQQSQSTGTRARKSPGTGGTGTEKPAGGTEGLA
jgi:BMFP domain-containing protein YqiC